MEPYRQHRKTRGWIAALTLTCGSIPALAQSPAPPPYGEEPIVIDHGAAKVGPAPTIAPGASPAIPVVPAAGQAGMGSHTREVDAEAMHCDCDGSVNVSAAASLNEKASNRVKHIATSRLFITAALTPAPTTVTAPAVRVQTPVASAPVVVMNEPGARPAPKAPMPVTQTLTFRFETLISAGVGLFGLLLAILVWPRISRRESELAQVIPQGSPAPPDPKSIQLLGQYNAGPKRENVEKFEIGPAYHEELQQKRKAEEANNAAAVELILNQNLILLAALNPGEERIIVQSDREDFAIPVTA